MLFKIGKGSEFHRKSGSVNGCGHPQKGSRAAENPGRRKLNRQTQEDEEEEELEAEAEGAAGAAGTAAGAEPVLSVAGLASLA